MDDLKLDLRNVCKKMDNKNFGQKKKKRRRRRRRR